MLVGQASCGYRSGLILSSLAFTRNCHHMMKIGSTHEQVRLLLSHSDLLNCYNVYKIQVNT